MNTIIPIKTQNPQSVYENTMITLFNGALWRQIRVHCKESKILEEFYTTKFKLKINDQVASEELGLFRLVHVSSWYVS